MIRSEPIQRHLVLSLFGLLVLVRAPVLVWPGRLWGDEGTIYFYQYYTSTVWQSLASVDLGYFSLFNKLAGLASVYWVPLIYAPVVLALFSFVIMLLPAWLLLYASQEFRENKVRYFLIVAVILLIQPNSEVWLNTVNSQFYLSLATAIILITSAGSRGQHIARLSVLLLGGLTGVVSGLLAPLFWLEYLFKRSPRRLHEALVLSLATLIQLVLVLTAGGRDTEFHFDLLPWALLVKQWLLPVLGGDITEHLGLLIRQHRLWEYSLLNVLAWLPFLILGLALAFHGTRQTLYLLGGAVFIAAVSFLVSIEAQNSEMILGHLTPFGGGRYYFAPNAMVAMALILWQQRAIAPGLSSARVFQWFSRLFISLVLIVGAYDYITGGPLDFFFFEGPSWPDEVRQWERGDSEVIRIWPEPWEIRLPRDSDTLPTLPAD